MARFVVLRHDVPSGVGRGLHWDFMLETGDVLCTWALAEKPEPTGTSCLAERLDDHRLIYLDYEGNVSGNRGTVTRLDRGDYTAAEDDSPRDDDSTVIVRLKGRLLKGTATLTRCAGEDQRWRFSFVSEGTAASGFAPESTAGEPSDSRGTV